MYSLYAITICIVIHIVYSSGETSDAFERVTSKDVAAYKEYDGFKMQTYEKNKVPETGKYKVCYCFDADQTINKTDGVRSNRWNCCKKWKKVKKGAEFVSTAYDSQGADACIIGVVDKTQKKIRSECLIYLKPDEPWYMKTLVRVIILIIIIGICLCVIALVHNFAKINDVIIEEKNNDRRPSTVW